MKRNVIRPNGIFRECTGTNFNDFYDCCIQTCSVPAIFCRKHCEFVHPESDECKRLCRLNDDICQESCNEVWPFNLARNPYETCARRYNCYNNGYSKKCVDDHKAQIYSCCMSRCDSPHVDCDRLCSNYRLNYLSRRP